MVDFFRHTLIDHLYAHQFLDNGTYARHEQVADDLIAFFEAADNHRLINVSALKKAVDGFFYDQLRDVFNDDGFEQFKKRFWTIIGLAGIGHTDASDETGKPPAADASGKDAEPNAGGIQPNGSAPGSLQLELQPEMGAADE